MKEIIKILKVDIFIYAILTIVLSIAMVSEAYLMQYIIDATTLNSVQEYLKIVFPILLFLLIQTVLYYFQQFLTAVLSKKSVYVYRKKVFENIRNTPLHLLVGEKNNKILASLTS